MKTHKFRLSGPRKVFAYWCGVYDVTFAAYPDDVSVFFFASNHQCIARGDWSPVQGLTWFLGDLTELLIREEVEREIARVALEVWQAQKFG